MKYSPGPTITTPEITDVIITSKSSAYLLMITLEFESGVTDDGRNLMWDMLANTLLTKHSREFGPSDSIELAWDMPDVNVQSIYLAKTRLSPEYVNLLLHRNMLTSFKKEVLKEFSLVERSDSTLGGPSHYKINALLTKIIHAS